MTTETLITPGATDNTAPAATGTDGAAASAPAAAASATAEGAAAPELAIPEAAQASDTGEGAAAAGQGAGNDEAANGGTSEADGAEGEGEGEGAANGAPETYADFTMPEGFTLPPEMGSELTAIAKELGLPQDKAQKLIDLGVKHAQGVQQSMQASIDAAATAWADAARTDPEIGGDNFGPNMALAKKAIATFGSPALVELLNQTRLSVNPEFLRLLYRVGDAISEDTLVDGDGGSGPAVEKDRAKRLYPNMS